MKHSWVQAWIAVVWDIPRAYFELQFGTSIQHIFAKYNPLFSSRSIEGGEDTAEAGQALIKKLPVSDNKYEVQSSLQKFVFYGITQTFFLSISMAKISILKLFGVGERFRFAQNVLAHY